MYYSGNKKFTSNFDAAIHFNKTKEETNFYYYDDVYDKIDWTIEPPESVQFYYREQAKRIRESYDYVILCFSGGIDSTNILNNFHFNKLKIDKIVTTGAFSQDSHSMVEENYNGEVYFVSHPYIKELGLESITQYIDYTEYFKNFDQLSISKYGSDWIHYAGHWFSPYNFFWRDFPKFVIPKGLENKKVAIILGRDKPALSMDGRQRLGFKFCDAELRSHGDIKSADNYDIINFYWDHNFPLLLIKQLHILKKAFYIKRTIRKDKMHGVQVISDMSVNDLVYDIKKPIIHQTKGKSPLFSIRDEYLINKKDADVYKFYMAGMNKFNQKIGLNGYTSFLTKFYRIE